MKTRKLKQFDVTLAPAHWDRQANRIVSFKLGSPLPKRTVEVATIGEMFERAADFADEYGAACRLRITPVDVNSPALMRRWSATVTSCGAICSVPKS